jgi:DMSO/TMAO reductase YedYZ molybdopterin-dependent catalytic subunit
MGTGLLLSSPRQYGAEHHVISAEPLEVACDLEPLTDRYTPAGDFYIRNHREVPRDEATGLLRVEGEVEKPQTLTQEDLARLPTRELGAVLECAGDGVGASGLVSNGLWTGWALADVLSLVRPASASGYLHLVGRDGYARSVPIDRGSGAGLLAIALNGRPLGRNHGAPWRALFPGWYGMDSVKWLDRISVSKTPLPSEGNAYFEIRRGSLGELDRRPLPRIQVKSVIVHPADGAVLRRRAIEIRGLAWSGEGRISLVEVSGDGGKTWRGTTLDKSRDYEWTLWKGTMELTERGALQFECRAKDGQGFAQPAQRDPQRIDGYVNNWYHRVRCVVAG